MKTAYFPREESTNEYVNIIKNAISQNEINVEGLINKNIIKGEYQVVNLNWFESIHTNDKLKAYEIFIKRYIVLNLLKLKKVRIIWTLHNRIPHDSEFDSLSIKLMRKLAKIADIIVIHSKDSDKVIKELNPKIKEDKIKYIPHPNYIDVYKNKKIDFRDKLNIKDDELVYLFFGQIRPYKNVELIIEAAKKSKIKAKFIIAGKPKDGCYEESIKKLLNKSDNIIPIFRYIADDEISSLIESSDIVVLPYNIKSSLNSGSAILAFSLGKTIICPNIATLKDFDNNNLFYSYEYSTEDEHLVKLTNSLKRSNDEFQSNREAFLQKGQSLKTIMENKYSHNKISEEYGKIYESLLNKQ